MPESTNAQIRIEIDGTFATTGDGLRIGEAGANAAIRWLTINLSAGIVIDGARNGRVFGRFVGTDAAGNVGPVNLTLTPPIPAGRTPTTASRASLVETSKFSPAVPVT